MSKQLLKHQIQTGQPDPILFLKHQIVPDIQDINSIELLSKRAYIISIKMNNQIQFDFDKLYYKVLIGEITIKQNQIFAILDTDLIVISKTIVDYLLEQEKYNKQENVIKVLQQMKQFIGLNYYQMKNILKESEIIKLNENHIIYNQGQIPIHCIILIKGQLQFIKCIKQIEIKLNLDKNYIGLYECINNKPIQYKVKTDSQCEILKIDKKILLSLENDLKIKKEEIIEISNEIIEKQLYWQQFKKNMKI